MTALHLVFLTRTSAPYLYALYVKMRSFLLVFYLDHFLTHCVTAGPATRRTIGKSNRNPIGAVAFFVARVLAVKV